MIVLPLVQFIVALIAALAIFKLYRVVAARDGTIALLVGAGIVIRSFLGQTLFWTSYLHLPIARGLQLGNGLWWYALDSTMYFSEAVRAANGGIRGIAGIDRTLPSPQHIQVLAVFVLLFGSVTSVALLMNLAAYVGTCLAIGTRSTAARVAIAAVSFSPSTILWSLQPLKDTLFLFLLAALFSAANRWRLNVCGDARVIGFCRTAAAFALIVFMISGIRWYAGIEILAAMLPFFLVVVARSESWRRAGAMSLVAFSIAVGAFLAGAGPYVLPQAATIGSPFGLVKMLDGVRSGFERAPAATVIRTGPRLPQPIVPAPPKLPPRVLREGESPAPAVAAPSSRPLRLLTGLIAVTVPHFLAQRTGLIVVGGGHGMWSVADVDTFVFDLLLVYAAAVLVRSRRVALTPLVVFACALALLTGLPVIYSVGQFATLFRFRSAIALTVVLIPVAAAAETTSSEDSAASFAMKTASPPPARAAHTPA